MLSCFPCLRLERLHLAGDQKGFYGHRPTFSVLRRFSPVWVRMARGRSTYKVWEDFGFLLGMPDQMPSLPLGGAVESVGLGWVVLQLLRRTLSWTMPAFHQNHRAAAIPEWWMVASCFMWNYTRHWGKRVTCHFRAPDPSFTAEMHVEFSCCFCFGHCLDIVSWYCILSCHFSPIIWAVAGILGWWDIGWRWFKEMNGGVFSVQLIIFSENSGKLNASFYKGQAWVFFCCCFFKENQGGKKSSRGNEDIMKTLFLKVFRAPLEAQW